MMFDVRTPVAFVEDDDDLRASNVQALQLAGFEAMGFASATEALKVLDADFPGVVVSDIRMPEVDGHEFFRRVQDLDPELPVILITGHADVDEAVAALQQGAYDFLAKPYATEPLTTTVRRALEARRLVIDNRRLRTLADAPSGDPLIGDTPVMQRLRDTIRVVAEANVDVLIEGETGVGKEMVARAIHRAGARRRKAFAVINCAALPQELIEAELFGHEAGAFPGALRRRLGRIDAAERGTLVLDEVESLPLAAQGKLLSVLEEREVTPLGSNEPHVVDFRAIATTQADLGRAVDDGGFRSDLYYRLNVVRLQVPPLRLRRDDIPRLFATFLGEAATRQRRKPPQLSLAVRRRLLEHPWPGNVRELRHYAELVVLGLADRGADIEDSASRSLPERVDAFEAQVLRDTLSEALGDARAAVARLGIPRKTFYDKLKRHGIDIGIFRPVPPARS
ncbi:sigma-54 dependent transcriptional regulator [Phenylobacterium sp.]|jgi:two-component system C4-dicarboxylate transport response regulator DctD|uniref:sigma-54-dependent transcriptional regulator n=1 Tax=Phenylobacterium sp. TaxID=1871053 RepID=UPI002E318794|nr:sigma-54 dependent transcriptional regulator [Phenylobacterium sp.]HEX3367442.1 sigma-54 dependent transcriptional regulator [Phenylobacterium sp.]